MIEELALAMILKDMPEEGLSKGEIGTVVLVHNRGEAYEVEFMEGDDSPYTKAVVMLYAADLREISPEEYDRIKKSDGKAPAE